MHQAMAATFERCIAEIKGHQQECRKSRNCNSATLAHGGIAVAKGVGRPRWKSTDIGLKASGVRIRFRWPT